MSRLFVGTAAAAGFAYAAIAAAQIVEIHHLLPKGGVQTDVQSTKIRVTGSTESKYDKVATSSLDAWVSVKAPDKPPRDKDKLSGTVSVEGTDVLSLSSGFPSAGAVYKVTFPYQDPRSLQVANQRISPIKLCNDKLVSLSGAARQKFLNEGGNIYRDDGYIATAKQSWRVRTQNSIFQEIKDWTDTDGINVTIQCAQLTGPKPRKDTTTSGADGKPPTTTPKATLAKVALRGEPQAWKMVGGQSCPTQVRLYGTVQTNRAFRGKAIFLGPMFLSPLQDLSFNDAGTRNLTSTYNAKWPAGPTGLAIGGAATAKPRSQQVTLRMNVADVSGKVLETAHTTETLTCRLGNVPNRIRN